jgi:hypothetical protein
VHAVAVAASSLHVIEEMADESETVKLTCVLGAPGIATTGGTVSTTQVWHGLFRLELPRESMPRTQKVCCPFASAV